MWVSPTPSRRAPPLSLRSLPTIWAQISCSPPTSMNGSTLRAEATNATATVSLFPAALISASNSIARNTVTGVSANVLTQVCHRFRSASSTSAMVGSVAGTSGSKATRAKGEALAGVFLRMSDISPAVCLRCPGWRHPRPRRSGLSPGTSAIRRRSRKLSCQMSCRVSLAGRGRVNGTISESRQRRGVVAARVQSWPREWVLLPFVDRCVIPSECPAVPLDHVTFVMPGRPSSLHLQGG